MKGMLFTYRTGLVVQKAGPPLIRVNPIIFNDLLR